MIYSTSNSSWKLLQKILNSVFHNLSANLMDQVFGFFFPFLGLDFLYTTSLVERNIEYFTHEGQNHKIIWNMKVSSMSKRNIITLYGCDILFILWRLISVYVRLSPFDCKSSLFVASKRWKEELLRVKVHI